MPGGAEAGVYNPREGDLVQLVADGLSNRDSWGGSRANAQATVKNCQSGG